MIRQRPPRVATSLPLRVAPASPVCAWRDALGPGYAVGMTEHMAQYLAATAGKPYRCV